MIKFARNVINKMYIFRRWYVYINFTSLETNFKYKIIKIFLFLLAPNITTIEIKFFEEK